MRFLLLIFLLVHASAARANLAYKFKNFGIEEGLPSTEVYQITQDVDGHIWLATDRGLSRYDGYTFTNYSLEDGLMDEVIFGFFPEENGRLWFYTFHGGIAYYHKDSLIEPPFNHALKSLLKTLKYPTILSLFVDENETVWMGTNNNYIIKIDRQKEPEVIYNIKCKSDRAAVILETGSKTWPSMVYTGGSSSEPIDQIIWLPKLDAPPYHVAPLPEDFKIKRGLRAKFYRISKDTILYASGPEIFKICKGKVISRYSLGARHAILQSIFIDKSNDLWVGAQGGVFRFANCKLTKPDSFLLSHDISSISQDHEGGYWFSSLNDGVFYIPHFNINCYSSEETINDKMVKIYSNSKNVFTTTHKGNILIFPNGKVNEKTLLKGTHQAIPHICIWRDTALIRRSDNPQLYFTHLVPQPYYSSSDYSLIEHNDDQSIFSWTLFEEELLLLDPKSQFREVLPKPKLRRPRCLSITADKSKIWLGFSTGLYAYEDGVYTNFGNRFVEFNGSITDLDLLEEPYLLVTTRGFGVLLYDYEKEEIIHHLSGIPNKYCGQSFVDNKGVVWVSSFSGVTRIDEVTSAAPKYHQFSVHTGLLSNEVFYVCSFKDQIWAASAKGVSYWQRDWVPAKREVKVAIDHVTANGKKISHEAHSTLEARQNQLQFSFSGISYQNPIQYQYRLQGLHSNWINTTDQKASYASLKPGDYVFELRAKSDSEIYSIIALTIMPPLWLRPWFISLILISLLSTVLIFIHMRYRIILKENKLYKLFINAEQKALRAQVNPHFLFNAFNSVLELLAQKRYDIVQEYMTSFSKIMRTVLTHARQKTITLRQEINLLHLYVHLEDLRFETNMRFQLEVDESLNTDEVLLPPLLLQPYLENAIKHGIRSRSDDKGTLRIRFQKKSDQLIATISDNGKGYDPKNHSKQGRESLGMSITADRLKLLNIDDSFKVEVRPLHLDSKLYPGTVITLFIPYKSTYSHEKFKIQSLNSR